MFLQHIGLAMNEELSLQARLLDDLDEEVDVVGSRMSAAKRALDAVYAKSKDCKLSVTILLLTLTIIGMLVVILWVF